MVSQGQDGKQEGPASSQSRSPSPLFVCKSRWGPQILGIESLCTWRPWGSKQNKRPHKVAIREICEVYNLYYLFWKPYVHRFIHVQHVVWSLSQKGVVTFPLIVTYRNCEMFSVVSWLLKASYTFPMQKKRETMSWNWWGSWFTVIKGLGKLQTSHLRPAIWIRHQRRSMLPNCRMLYKRPCIELIDLKADCCRFKSLHPGPLRSADQ